MNAIVTGLGSMGRRRIRLLKRLDPGIKVIGIDTVSDRRKQAEKELMIRTENSIEEACQKWDIAMAFVSTSPLSHASVIAECLKNNLHVFSEINLMSDGYSENIELSKEMGKVLFLSSTFMYRKEMQYIKRRLAEYGLPVQYTYHAGQYLPDWHPWENYKDFFVGKKITNACRELMAIEFPWIIDTFGEVVNFYSTRRKISTLEIDYPDTFQIVFEHESGHQGMILLDIVSRKATRRFELVAEGLFLTWNGTPDSLMEYNLEKLQEDRVNVYDSFERRQNYGEFIIEDAYFSEIENFFDVIKGSGIPRYSFEKDREILCLIDRIEGD